MQNKSSRSMHDSVISSGKGERKTTSTHLELGTVSTNNQNRELVLFSNGDFIVGFYVSPNVETGSF